VTHIHNSIKWQRIWMILSSVTLAFLVLGLSLWMLASPRVAYAAMVIVDNTGDSGTGTLRWAIANADPGDTIVFDESLSGQTITLASTLEITQDLTIDGSDLITPVTLSGNDAVRVFYIYTDTVVTFDSLTIAHGRTTNPEPEESYSVGGGIKIEPNAVVTLTHSTVFSNTSIYSDTEEGEYVGYGGGIYNQGILTAIDDTFSDNSATIITEKNDSEGGAIYNSGTLRVADSTFSDNYARKGAGIINTRMGKLTVQNSFFSANISTCRGAGIQNVSSVATVDNSIISDNKVTGTGCESGGSGINNRNGTITVTNSTISGNIAKDYGGGLENYRGTAIVMNSTILSNTAGEGGGIYNWWEAALTVTNSSIYSNTAISSGGGLFSGPNVDTSVTLINSTLYANSAKNGGGISNFADTPGGALMTLINTTLISNTATLNGGGIYNWDTTPSMSNVILWDNSAAFGSQISNTNAITIPTIGYSDIQDSGGSGAGWDVSLGNDNGGNIESDPMLVDANTGDLRLQLTSPANDAGDNHVVPANITTDLTGAPRFMDVPAILDTGNGTPPIVDMGAYETGPALKFEKSVAPEKDPDNSVVTYTLALSNTGGLSDTNVTLTDKMPSGVDFGGWVSQPAGMIQAGNTLTWTGILDAGDVVTAIFTATLSENSSGAIVNIAYFNGTYQNGSSSASFLLPEEIYIYLPIIINK
jgi:uncharacterized repeat protein (TIGR01451 family)